MPKTRALTLLGHVQTFSATSAAVPLRAKRIAGFSPEKRIRVEPQVIRAGTGAGAGGFGGAGLLSGALVGILLDEPGSEGVSRFRLAGGE